MPALFADKNLAFAIVDEVRRRRADDGYTWVQSALEGPYKATGATPTWEDLAHNECERVPELERLIASLPIDPDELARIDSLTLDGDRDAYSWTFPSWWDFGDHFTIRDLSGLDQCRAVEYLLLGQGLVQDASLRPVARLSALRELHACALCGLRDIEALLDVPSLRKLVVVNVPTSHERTAWEAVIETLRGRGVAV